MTSCPIQPIFAKYCNLSSKGVNIIFRLGDDIHTPSVVSSCIAYVLVFAVVILDTSRLCVGTPLKRHDIHHAVIYRFRFVTRSPIQFTNRNSITTESLNMTTFYILCQLLTQSEVRQYTWYSPDDMLKGILLKTVLFSAMQVVCFFVLTDVLNTYHHWFRQCLRRRTGYKILPKLFMIQFTDAHVRHQASMVNVTETHPPYWCGEAAKLITLLKPHYI